MQKVEIVDSFRLHYIFVMLDLGSISWVKTDWARQVILSVLGTLIPVSLHTFNNENTFHVFSLEELKQKQTTENRRN